MTPPIIPVWHYAYERLFQPYVRSVEVNGWATRTFPSGKSGSTAARDTDVRVELSRVRFISLQARFLLGTVLVLLLVMAAVIAGGRAPGSRAAIVDEVERRGKVIAESLAAVSRVPLLLYNFTALEQNVARVAGEADVVYGIVLDGRRESSHS